MDTPEEMRHETLYHATGDIVLSAVESATGHTIIFRLDRIFLAGYSSEFRAMFADLTGNGQYDGVPRVNLPDDAYELARLFEACIDPL